MSEYRRGNIRFTLCAVSVSIDGEDYPLAGRMIESTFDVEQLHEAIKNSFGPTLMTSTGIDQVAQLCEEIKQLNRFEGVKIDRLKKRKNCPICHGAALVDVLDQGGNVVGQKRCLHGESPVRNGSEVDTPKEIGVRNDHAAAMVANIVNQVAKKKSIHQ